MKSRWFLAALLVVALSGSVMADAQTFNAAGPLFMTPRQIAMGNAAIGVADDAGAWYQNPAGLAALNLTAAEGKNWAHDAILSNGFTPAGTDYNILNGSWSGWKPAEQFGIGGGLSRWPEFINFGGLGVGTQFRHTKLLVGANFTHYNIEHVLPPQGVSFTSYNVGLMYPFSDTFKLGVRANNLSMVWSRKRFYDAGIGWRIGSRLLLAADATDVSNISDDGPYFNVGAEFKAGKNMDLRAGMRDDGTEHNLAAGLGIRLNKSWRIDGAYTGMTNDEHYWIVGAGLSF